VKTRDSSDTGQAKWPIPILILPKFVHSWNWHKQKVITRRTPRSQQLGSQPSRKYTSSPWDTRTNRKALTNWWRFAPNFLPGSVLSRLWIFKSLSWKCWIEVCICTGSSDDTCSGLWNNRIRLGSCHVPQKILPISHCTVCSTTHDTCGVLG